jgi:carnitine 3-dehydrogenase
MVHSSDVVAVIGCGLIGQSWAALFLAHGHDVRAWDPAEQARSDFVARVNTIVSGLVVGKDIGTLSVEATLPAVLRHTTFAQENAPESVPLKRALYAEIEASASGETTIASSTSSLVWSELSAEMRRPERLITAHPFNPPHLMPLVELFGVDPIVLARADAFYRGLGRVPVRLRKEAAGHIANRLAAALWREAVNIVGEGIADVADVDAALVNGPGLRWSVVGAHMAYHLGGGAGGIQHYLSHLGPSQERRWATLGTPRLTPEICALLVQGIEAEAAGRSIADLEAERDDGLRRMLAARKGAPR